ncbi:hypothetical protein COHA_007820 [Chlorella ohadii]|uniref:Uncharacterized protein n=1 Tax=Chlorella ohadii TaxID=2649997 RepID=A0AAD5DL22_9CHLO|nr:hypothetical protein COHA_007820 [Chlorella ohadii]
MAAAARDPAGLSRRALLAAGDEVGWRNVTVRNRCPHRVALKAAYTLIPGVDKGRPCPNAVAGADGPCSTDWLFIGPGKTAVLSDLPEMLWAFSAYVLNSAPRYYISRQTADAYLGAANDLGTYCSIESEGKCIWWAVPELAENEAGGLLTLTCDDYDQAAAGLAIQQQQLADIEFVNECPLPVRVKLAYSLAEGETGEGCAINTWFAQDHKCITEWAELEAGESRILAQTPVAYWDFGAHVAGNESADLAKMMSGAFQGWNDTTACPESDFYGGPYPCEWWAPSCVLCDSYNVTTAEPVVLSCDGYLGTPAVSQATLS